MKQFNTQIKCFFLLAFALITGTAELSAQVCIPTNVPNFSKCCTIGLASFKLGSQIKDSVPYDVSIKYYDRSDSASGTYASGTTYSMDIKVGQFNNSAVCVWVDWNKNDTFELDEIEYYNINVTSNTTINTSFTPQLCNDSFKVRVLVDYYYYYSDKTSFDPCSIRYGDVTDYKIHTSSNPSLDVGNVGITSGSILQNGSNTLSFKFGNFSDSTIDSVRVGYSINNGTPVIETLTGLNLTACALYSHTFATSFNATNGTMEIKTWVNYPNGISPDFNTNNDTSSLMACVALSGNFTINPASASQGTNFKSFTDAATALNSCGVGGHVTITVAPGTYTDSIAIGSILGASDTSTVTINAVDTATRIIKTSGANIITLKDVSYLTIKNLNFRISTNNGGMCLTMTGACHDLKIESCNFRNTQLNGFSYGIQIVSAAAKGGGSSAPSHVTLEKNTFKNCYYGAYVSGTNTAYGTGNILNSNYFDSLCSYPIYEFYQDSLEIVNNTTNNVIGYGALLYLSKNSKFHKNKISSNGYYGVYGYDFSDGEISNNFIRGSSNTFYTAYLYSCNNVNNYHNTYVGNNTSATAVVYIDGGLFDFRNNICAALGSAGYTLYSTKAANLSYCDYNQYYSGASNTKFVGIGSDYADLAALKGQNGFNDNSTAASPLFVSNTNLHLKTTAASPTGDNTIGISDDADNDSRCAIAPSIGADESKYVGTKPLSNFTMQDTAYINSPVVMTNKGKFNEGKIFEWFIDTATVPTSAALDASYTFSNTGTFNVKLKTYNCFGSHDTTKTVVIITPPAAPVINFKASALEVDAGDIINFTDLSSYGPVTWNWTITGGSNVGSGTDFDYVNGTDSFQQNPSVTFYIAGFYNVCLSSSNSVGSNTVCKQLYIKVYEPLLMCASSTSNAEFGHFYDEGGKTGNYPANGGQTCDLLISPCKGPITMNFTKIDIDTFNSALLVYDGINDQGKVISQGGIYNAPQTLIAQSGNMYIKWINSWTAHAGWEASWSTANSAKADPLADFAANDTGYENSTHRFTLKYFKDDVTYDLDFDNDGNIDLTATTRDIEWYYGGAGTYPVTCYATGCNGVDTFIKTVVIVTPTVAPSPVLFVVDNSNGMACKLKQQASYVVEVNQQISLYDRSGGGATSWDYQVLGPASNYNWDNGNTIQNPQLTFYNTGTYSIKLIVTNAAGSANRTFSKIITVVNSHCVPTTGGANGNSGLSAVSFKNIYKSSSQYNTYSNYTVPLSNNTPMACVESGSKYPITLRRGSGSGTAKFGIWIDYNQDGDFTDAGEQIKVSASTSAINYTDTIKISNLSKNVLWGKTVLRVGCIDASGAFAVCGNSTSAGELEDYSIYITDDNTPPVIYLYGNNPDTMSQGSTYNNPGAYAIDNVSGIIGTTSTNNIQSTAQGTYQVKYMATDGSGNEAIPVYRTVVVGDDKTAPVITLLGNNPYYQEVYTTYNEPGATAYDSVDGVISTVNISGVVNTNILAPYILYYSASDTKGNTDTISRIVIVKDGTPPVITLVGADSIYLGIGNSYVEPGFSATDNYDKTSTAFASAAHIDSSVTGVTQIVYTSTDSSGNVGTKTRWVFVGDKIAPIITLNGGDTLYIEVFSTFTDPGSVVTDNKDINLTATVSGSVNTGALGANYLLYFAIDNAGNSTSKTRVVIVRKTTKPLITLKGLANVSLVVNQSYTDPGVTITDAYYAEATLQNLLSTGGTFINPPTAAGNYYTWYHVTDPIGNAADTVFRTFGVAVGINNVGLSHSLEIYPNPASNMVTIKSEEAIQSIQLFDAAGKSIITNTFTKGSLLFNLNTTELANGLYMIRINTQSGINEQKLIISK
jgi:PKD repeat protein